MFFAERLFTNGNIITMNPAKPRAEAVATFGDRILAVGRFSELQGLVGAQTKIIDLGGKTLLPGFNDAHGHLIQFGLDSMNLEVPPECAPNIPALKELVRKRAGQLKPGEWLLGWGWDESRMEEGLAPTVQDLSEAAPDNPVMLIRTCYHMVAVNELALKLGGVSDETPDPEGGKIVRDAAGKPTGILQDTAQDFVKSIIPPPRKAKVKRAIAEASKIYNSQGITSTCDAGSLGIIEDEIPAWCESSVDGTLNVRTNSLMLPETVEKVRNLGLTSNFGNDFFRFGCVKFFMDGSLGGGTAGMTKPYKNPSYGTGLIYMEQEELTAKVKVAHDAGYQISIHGIGDRTLDIVLSAYESALRDTPRKDHRHRIEHASMAYPHLLDRAKALDLTINMNPGFLYFLGIAHIQNIGDEVAYEFAMKTAMEKGIVVSAGSDRPVIHGHPKYSLFAMTQRETISGLDCGHGERLTAEQALYAYTVAGAYQSFEEHKKGSIEAGKLADFVLLSLDPTAVPPQALLNMEILMTVLGGRIVYEA